MYKWTSICQKKKKKKWRKCGFGLVLRFLEKTDEILYDLPPPAQPIYFLSHSSPANSSHTTEVSHLFSALHTCLLSIQSPDLHQTSLTYLFMFSVPLAQWLDYFYLKSRSISTLPTHSLITVFLPFPPLSSQRFVSTMFVSSFSVPILVQEPFQINLLPPALQWNCVFATTFS